MHGSAVPGIGAGEAAAPPRELEFIYPARIDHAVLLFASPASQTHTPGADRFEYTCPVHYTESDLRYLHAVS